MLLKLYHLCWCALNGTIISCSVWLIRSLSAGSWNYNPELGGRAELSTLSETGNSTATADYCPDRIENVIDCIDELISAYDCSAHVQGFLSLHRRLSQMLPLWRHMSISCCSVAAVGGGSAVEVHRTSEAVQKSISMWIRWSFCILVDILGTR